MKSDGTDRQFIYHFGVGIGPENIAVVDRLLLLLGPLEAQNVPNLEDLWKRGKFTFVRTKDKHG